MTIEYLHPIFHTQQQGHCNVSKVRENRKVTSRTPLFKNQNHPRCERIAFLGTPTHLGYFFSSVLFFARFRFATSDFCSPLDEPRIEGTVFCPRYAIKARLSMRSISPMSEKKANADHPVFFAVRFVLLVLSYANECCSCSRCRLVLLVNEPFCGESGLILSTKSLFRKKLF